MSKVVNTRYIFHWGFKKEYIGLSDILILFSILDVIETNIHIQIVIDLNCPNDIKKEYLDLLKNIDRKHEIEVIDACEVYERLSVDELFFPLSTFSLFSPYSNFYMQCFDFLKDLECKYLGGEKIERIDDLRIRSYFSMNNVASDAKNADKGKRIIEDIVSLNEIDLFNAIFSLPDAYFMPFYEMFGEKNTENIISFKKRCALSIIQKITGESASFCNIIKIYTAKNRQLIDILFDNGIEKTRNEIRRKFLQGAVKLLPQRSKISDCHITIEQKLTICIGKKKIIEIEVC